VHPHVSVNGPLGAQFYAWEAATALASRLIAVNPFDQPNVAESKDNTKRLLAKGVPAQEPSYVDGVIEVHGPAGGATVAEALSWVLGEIAPTGYLAVMAFLDRFGDAAAAQIRPALAAATERPVTFGWGPRFLHSTGQYHKGGPANGAFLQITGAVVDDLDVPGQPYTFGQLQAAQAAGDREALMGRGRPLLWLHLRDRVAGVAQLLEAARGLR
jgi:glucose-6-phosphate isomerase